MNIEIKPVSIDEKEVLRNLLEKYDYEFSKWDQRDVNSLGLYGYKYLDYYWTEDKRFAYFILVNQKLAGFVMINDLPEVDDRETDFQIAEFFIFHKYRRLGIGKKLFFYVLNKHRGRWQLKCHPKNVVSLYFWKNVINEYTSGKYEYVEAYPNTEYDDGSLANVFFFES